MCRDGMSCIYDIAFGRSKRVGRLKMKKIETFIDAMNYIEEVTKYECEIGLENIINLLSYLGNPQDQLSFIHVGGTNGKGSISTFLSGILSKAGYRVGRYLSPTIYDYCERIQVQTEEMNRWIEKEQVIKHLNRIQEACSRMMEHNLPHPTIFEVETAMAMLEFVEAECDLVVLEVGMGGRLDATNVVRNVECAVFASISMDHMQFLGNTIEKIAIEKAGIIKPGCSVISYDQIPQVEEILRCSCVEKQVDFHMICSEDIKDLAYGLEGSSFSYKSYERLRITLLGAHQFHNASVAIETIEVLKKRGYRITESHIREGLLHAKWPGRFSIVRTNPMIIVDGAHNEAAAVQLKGALKRYFTQGKVAYIMGIFKDKDYEAVVRNTADFASKIYTITPDNDRALPSCQLKGVIEKYNKNVVDCGDITSALKCAEQENDCIICFGSLSFLGDIYRYYGLSI